MLIARATVADTTRYGIVDGDEFTPIRDTPFGAIQTDGRPVPLTEVQLLSPTTPSRVLVVLAGFLPDDQTKRPPDLEPVLFPKVTTQHGGPGSIVVRPSFLSSTLDMEAELALVIGRPTRHVGPDEGWQSILGFTVYNDFTASEFLPVRDFYRAKSIDTFSCFGPWITDALSEEQIVSGLSIVGRVNGERQQLGTTSRFKFSPGEIVSYASRFVTLLPGDIISLGTPPPAAPVQPGDTTEAMVEGVGTLTNRIVEERSTG